MAVWFGFNFPFFRGNTLIGTTSQVLPRQEDNRLIRNDLLQGLLTNKGERAFRPGFGADITNHLFEQNDEETRSTLSNLITSHIAKFHPRVSVSTVDISEDINNPNMMVIKVFGRTELDASNVDDLLVRFMIPIAGTLGTTDNLSRTNT